MSSPTPPKRRARWLRIALPVLALVAICWFALRGGHAGQAPKAAKSNAPVPATLVRVARVTVPNFATGVGTVTPQATVTVKSRIDGQLESLHYVEGQDVKAGQVLARLDARALRAQLEQARAQLARDEAQAANAQRDLARYTQLMKEDATSQQTLDTARAQAAQLQASLLTDRAQIHYAEVQLGYTTITAPLSGRVGARLVDVGNIVHAADATGLVVINQIDPITVVFTLPGDAVQAINRAQRTGQNRQANAPLQVLAYAREGNELLAKGELVLVNNQVDVASGTVQLKARFANAGHQLWPGQYVNVRLLLGNYENALTVPAPVVQRSQQGTYAYVIGADGRAQMRPIDVLQIQDGKAVVAKGLAENDTVVLDGQYKIKPGTAVVAQAEQAKQAAQPERKTE